MDGPRGEPRPDADEALKVQQDADARAESLKLIRESLKRRASLGGVDTPVSPMGSPGPSPVPSDGEETPALAPSRASSAEFTITAGSALATAPVVASISAVAAPPPCPPVYHARAPTLHKSASSAPDFDVTAPDAFQRVVITTGGASLSKEQREACAMLTRCLELRAKHAYRRADYYWGPLRPEQFPSTPRPELVGGITCDVDVALIRPWRHHPSSDDIAGAGIGRGVSGDAMDASAMRHGDAPASAAVFATTSGAAASAGSAAPHHSRSAPPAKLDSMFYRRRHPPQWRPFDVALPPPAALQFRIIDGVIHAFSAAVGVPPHVAPAPAPAVSAWEGAAGLDESAFVPSHALFAVSTWETWLHDYIELTKICHTPFVKSFTYHRLEMLQSRFQLHCKLNSGKEVAESKSNPHRDFYNVRKVDTHIHHSACMNQKHLLRFIKSKLKNDPEEVVIFRDGKHLTLLEVFESLGLTAYDLSTDTLDMHADMNTFQRFDRFNLKYNPVGQSRLREVFMKTDNFLKGKYLAEITQQVFSDLEASKYTLAEYRLSIYGRSPSEWSKLAAWVVDNRLASPNVRWMIQIPRLYETYKASGEVRCFQDMIMSIFKPLFDVSVNPSSDPKLHQFLALIVGFDSVDDESRQETRRDAVLPLPAAWDLPEQPPYHYWTFFIAENLKSLNLLRASRGLSQFSYRPHAGEAGDPDHLAAAFLTAESVNHGINLQKIPPLQYLYYLAQVGLAVSPLSNNRLFLEYSKSPFFEFYQKGLNVSLSTDDPLMLHITKEPLVEEYCVAAQVWRLSAADMCEIARNSVLQSGFEYPWKAHFIGPNYAVAGPAGNDIHMTNVPYIRLQYRLEALAAELQLVEGGASPGSGSAPQSPTTAPIRMKRRASQIAAAAAATAASVTGAALYGSSFALSSAAGGSSASLHTPPHHHDAAAHAPLAAAAAAPGGPAPTILTSPRFGLGLSLATVPHVPLVASEEAVPFVDMPGAARGIAAAAAWAEATHSSSSARTAEVSSRPPVAPPRGETAVGAASSLV